MYHKGADQTNHQLANLLSFLALKADRKRLKGEKLELLNQMKQLYGALEEKEAELRDFIRNYEQRMRESDESIKQVKCGPLGQHAFATHYDFHGCRNNNFQMKN